MQLLVQFFNQVHAASTVVHLFAFASSIQIISTYTTIPSTGLSVPLLIILLAELLDTYIVFVGVFGYAGKVYLTSETVLEELKRRGKGMKAKKIPKMLRSLPTLKIGFGTGNFIDQTTPLVFLSANNARIVDLLLLKK